LGGLQPVSRTWGGFSGALTRCKGGGWCRGWGNPLRGTRSAEVKGARFALIRPRPLRKWSTALTVTLPRGVSNGGGEAEAHTVAERATDARARGALRIVLTHAFEADVEVTSSAFTHPSSGTWPDPQPARPVASRLEAIAPTANWRRYEEVPSSASKPRGRSPVLGANRSRGRFKGGGLIAEPGGVYSSRGGHYRIALRPSHCSGRPACLYLLVSRGLPRSAALLTTG
jgi:hypothetical protein